MINKNQIKIFNSEKEAGNLEGTLIEATILIDEKDILENIFYALQGKFTPMQRLESTARNEAEKLKADYGIIVDKYKIYENFSWHLQKIKTCDELQTIKVNFYKQK